MCPCRQVLAVLALAICLAPLVSAAPTTKDAVTEALRQAAEKAIKDGKHEDAVSVLTKIIEGDWAKYQDYLLLGRSCEKLNKNREAVAAYRKVLDLVSESSDKREERSARTEAKQKLNTLNVMQGKIDQFAKDTEKKIWDLIKEADKLKDWDAAGHLMKNYVAVRQIRGGGESVQYCQVAAEKAWQGFGYDKVTQGKTYRIRAVGRWKLSAKLECSPDGAETLPANNNGPVGCLLLLVSKSPQEYRYIRVGSEVTFVAPLSGQFLFVCNEGKASDASGKDDNTGFVHVVIEELD